MFLLCAVARSERLTRIHYYEGEKPTEAQIEKLKLMYGAEIYPLPLYGTPPAVPVKIEGIVWHSDPAEDPKWVLGDKNIAMDHREYGDSLTDKWNEALFLKEYAPQNAPKNNLANSYVRPGESPKDIEAIRDRILADQGPSILKIRNGFGSDGYLPKTDTDWGTLWKQFEKHSLKPLQSIRANDTDPDIIQERTESLEFREGIVLLELLTNPSNVIVQKLIPSNRELRVHVLQGEILKGATVARFDHFGDYVTDEEVALSEKAVAQLLKASKEKYPGISFGADILLAKDANGKLNATIIDFNVGVDSGMLDAENDIYVSNLATRKFTGKSTPYLKALEQFERAEMKDKLSALKNLVGKFGTFVEEHESSGLWNKIVDGYIDSVETIPSPMRAKAAQEALSHLISVKHQDPWTFQLFLRLMKDRFPQVDFSPKLPARLAAKLARERKECTALGRIK